MAYVWLICFCRESRRAEKQVYKKNIGAEKQMRESCQTVYVYTCIQKKKKREEKHNE